MTLLWQLRLLFKDLWCYSGLGSMLTEYCEDCGVRQPLVWWAPDDLWTELTDYVAETPGNAAGILCPRCFDRRARRARINLRWVPTVDYRAFPRVGDSRTKLSVKRPSDGEANHA